MECCSKSDEKIDGGGEGEPGCHMTEGVLHGLTREGRLKFVSFPDFLLLMCGQLLQGLSVPGYPANWIDFWGENIWKVIKVYKTTYYI